MLISFTLLLLNGFWTGQALANPRPLVIWHGLGDTYSSPGIVEFQTAIKEMYSGIFTHSIYMDEDPDKDKEATFYGNVNEQIQYAAEQISQITELQDGFDAIGFSQGGQFLRAYVEQFNSPPIHNLITFGSQHMGISDIPVCRPLDVLCQIARRATKRAVYGTWAQQNLVQAQYFRDPGNLPVYLEANKFLPIINNELAARNKTFSHNLASLNALVLVMFTEDTTVVPKETAWFGSEVVVDDVQSQVSLDSTERYLIPIEMHPLYTEDWIGLRELDEKGGVVFEECEGEHMEISACWERIVKGFIGTSRTLL